MAHQFNSTFLVLRNYDLLHSIFEYFDLCNLECIMSHDYSLAQRKTRQSLLWAALTSKAFLEPAMNVLWREMETITPLYLVLPALRKKDSEDDSDEEGQDSESEYANATLTEPLDCDDVQRMVFYARRIRSLHFHYEGDLFNIHLDLSIAFLTRINQLDAFLSLRGLTVDAGLIKFQHTTLRTLSPPNLEDLTVTQVTLSPQEEIWSKSSLETLARKSCHIKTLVVEGNHTSITFNVLPNFSKVQNLTMYFRNPTVISLSLLEQIASSMISLQSLEMDLEPAEFKNDLNSSSCQFMSLTDLVVSGPLQSVGKVLEVVHAPSLCHLSLGIGIQAYGFDTCTSIQSFIPVKMIDKVQSFSVSSARYTIQRPGPIDFGSRISPFIIFEQLEEFDVHVPTLRISTTHLAMFLNNNRYLSNLQHLTLQYDRPREINQSLSIAALPLIADACPKLLHLAVSIYDPDQSEMRITTRSAHNLHTIRFDPLPDWNESTILATALSSFLDHLFPGLIDSDYWSREVSCASRELREKWWKGVQDMIKAHQIRRV